MKWNEQIRLYKLTEAEERTNEHGFPVPLGEAGTTVFANKKSVGFSEFYKASQAGYAAELKFDVYSAEYDGQQVVEYPVSSNTRFRVIRSYVHSNGEFTELTLGNLPEAQASQEGG